MEATRTIQIGGQTVRLLERGDGPPVVVLHGWGGRIESMTPTIACLSRHFRVVAIDLPGFGESPLPTEVWGTPEYAMLVRDLLRELGIEHAHLVGHSFGAKVGFFLSASMPGLFDKIVLVGSSGLRIPPSAAARAKRALSRMAKLSGSLGPPGRKLRERIYRSIASQDYRDAGPMRPIFVKVVNENLEDVLPKVTSSTLLVWGENDDSTPISHAKRMEQLIPDAGLVVFEGAGHFAYLDQPDRFCRIASHFFGAGSDG